MKKAELDLLIKKLKIPKTWPMGFSLKPEGKRILKALVAEGLSAEEIAKLLNKSIASIYNIYSRDKIK
ncbi:MAG: helix-turn-helix domain-containing protein, partial [Patescibacteria group bacterium]